MKYIPKLLLLFIILASIIAGQSITFASFDMSQALSVNQSFQSAGYQIREPREKCKSEKFAGDGIINTIWEPKGNKILVTVFKCDNSRFLKNGEIEIIRDNTGRFENWEYDTSTRSYRCGQSGIIKFSLRPSSNGKSFIGEVRKCDNGSFTHSGTMYILRNGDRIRDSEGREIKQDYDAGDFNVRITFSPIEESRHNVGSYEYQAELDTNNEVNGPTDFIHSGEVEGWTDYDRRDYLSGNWPDIVADESEVSFLFDPESFGIRGGWHGFQVHEFPKGQNYPHRSGIIEVKEMPTPTSTSTHTRTHTPTPSPTYTSTPTPTGTWTPTKTSTPTDTPIDTPQVSTDLVAEHLEVTQGIQDLSNSVRLVQDKRTYVRLHVRSDDGLYGTTAKLIAKRGSNQMELTALNSGGQIVVQSSPDRGELDHAFLFELPDGYRQGNVSLTGIVNPNGLPAESNSNNNRISISVQFEPVPEQNLVIAAIGYGDDVYPSEFHLEKLESWLEKAYPVSSYNVEYRKYYYNPNSDSPPDCNQVNAFLLLKYAWDIDNNIATTGTKYYGMVADDGGFMRGCAWIDGNAGSGPTGTNTWGWDNDGSYGDWYGAHELGHTYNRHHAQFCNATDYTNSHYPHPNGWISPVLVGDNAIYGFDLDTKEIYGPDSQDLMTYCDNQWISDFTYEALMDYFQNSPVIAAGVTANRMDRLLVIGTIEPNTNDVRLEPLSIIPNAMEIKQRIPGDYAIVLRNSAGNELARYPFTPDIIEFGLGLGNEGHAELFGINELVPYVDGTVRVDIEKSGTVIKTVQAGAARPTVTLDDANGGLTVDGDKIHLSWSGNDADGDTLSYLIQYSADNGKTWEVITPYTTNTSIAVNASNIEDIETALFRVVATDGINTTTSDINTTARYFSSSTGGRAGNIGFADEDILMLDPDSGQWSRYFDGSDVGLRNRDVDAFHILDDGNILLSLDRPRTIGGTKFDDSDIIKFTATSLGNRTRGKFTMYLDGSDVQLTKASEDIDAIALLANGDLVISTLGTARVTGVVARDEDMLRFHKTRLGNKTQGTWSLYFDGSDVQLSNKNEDIWAAWVDESIQQVHLSTLKNYNAGGLKGDSDDILACDGSVGNNTRCKLSLAWDGDAHGFGSERIDGYSIGPAPALTVFSAGADAEDGEDDAPETDDESEDMLDDDEYTVHIYLPFISR